MFTVSDIESYPHCHVINVTLDDTRKAQVWYYPDTNKIVIEISTGFLTYKFDREAWGMYTKSINLAFDKMKEFRDK